ncbi:hypothetical protein OG455_26040 [Kitasatospora sp. NBC_01287]|uniref:hypothetical protein n=1 Tax=Kitasatospora sp. NBC_01287 TaxID=2903573 RepID=UPI00224E77E8|nr:hypothetical protein [Kitasatospora sp. NBC_01287]MCX4748935.1 hypothetical protein [Kitasatospora sp. NBC_01287]
MNVSLTDQARRLAALRGGAEQRGLDARALAALAANPGCRRRALLDAAGVDKGAVAGRLGRPAPFGRSPFAIARGTVFEARLKADDCAALLEPLRRHLGLPPGDGDRLSTPDLLPRSGPAVRAARTGEALAEAVAASLADPGAWTLLDHPMLRLTVAGAPAYLEPDAVVVHGGRCTVVEVKSFPVLDGSADPAKVGAAARQAAVYVLALQEAAGQDGSAGPYRDQALPGSPELTVLLVCPKDFGQRPVAAAIDVRRELATTRRALARLTRIEELLAALPPGTTFDLAPDQAGQPTRPAAELAAAVDEVPAAYGPECLSACELGFHCRAQAREAGAVEQIGRGVRADLGDLRTVGAVLAACATGPCGAPPQGPAPQHHAAQHHAAQHHATEDPAAEDPAAQDPAAERLRYAAQLRAEALAGAGTAHPTGVPR